MTYRTSVAVFFALISSSVSALTPGSYIVDQAREFTVWEQSNFKDNQTYVSALAFMGYVVATTDFLEAMNAVCRNGEKTTNGQMAAVVAKWIRDNPKEWSKSSVEIVSSALRSTYPCKSQ